MYILVFCFCIVCGGLNSHLLRWKKIMQLDVRLKTSAYRCL